MAALYGLAAFKAAVDLLGGVAATAQILKRSSSAVSNVYNDYGRGIPRGWCKTLEKATKGMVTSYQLRPDIPWK